MTRTLIATLLTTTALALGACVGGPASLGGEPPLTPTSRYQLQVEPDLDRIALAVHDTGLSAAQNGALQELVRRYRYVDAAPMVTGLGLTVRVIVSLAAPPLAELSRERRST